MRGWKHAALALTAVIVAAAFIGCEGEEGPQGPPGIATCTETCHTDSYAVDDYLLAYQAEYEGSGHANMESFVRGSSSCARCHNSEGFTHYVEAGEAIEVIETSPIGCFACHAPHTNQDFSLRTMSAVTLDYGGAVYDKLESNLCVNCHQSRLPDPLITDLETAITSSRWGPHHGPQSGLLIGEGAYVFDEAYDNSMHRTVANGCVGCHMAETAGDGLGGGHTFSVAYEYHGAEEINGKGCFGCHTDWDEDDENATEAVEDYQDDFETGITALKDALIALGWLTSSGSVNGSGIPADVDARGAVFNYKFLTEDASMGVHNPKYADDVLEATQAYVDLQVVLAGK